MAREEEEQHGSRGGGAAWLERPLIGNKIRRASRGPILASGKYVIHAHPPPFLPYSHLPLPTLLSPSPLPTLLPNFPRLMTYKDFTFHRVKL